MAGTASKRPYSPDKMVKPTDYPVPGQDVDNRATACYSPSEKKRRIEANRERHKSDLDEEASVASIRNQATDLRRIVPDQEVGHEFRYQSKNFSKNTSSSLRTCSDSKPNSVSSGMKTESSFLTTPEDCGIQIQDDVSELRNWWAGLKSKPAGCGNCGSTAVFENFTTSYIREQLDAEYAIKLSVQNAERIQREKEMKEDQSREEAFSRSRWGRGTKLGEYKDDKEREKTNIPSPKGKGKEKEAIKSKKLGRLLGTASCPGCDNCICLGCLNPLEDSQVAGVELSDLPEPGNLKAERSYLRKSGLWCCDEGRVVAIALVLACLDEDALGLSLGNDHSDNNSPNRKGFGGAVKRGIRSLKDKITENALQISPSHKSKSKARGPKGNGTGYGSGGYGNSVGLFGLEFHASEDWEEEPETSDSDDLDNDGGIFPTSDVVPAIDYINPYTSYFKPLSPLPSVHFSGLGQTLGDSNIAHTTKTDPPQAAELSATDYIDLTMEDPPSSVFPVPIGSHGSSVVPSYFSWPGVHSNSNFSSRGRGAGRGRGGVYIPPRFLGPGQTLGGPVAGYPTSYISQKAAGEFAGADKSFSSLPSVWAHHFPQYTGPVLPQEALDDLLTKASTNSGPVNLSGSGSAELDNILLGSMVPPDFPLQSSFHPMPYTGMSHSMAHSGMSGGMHKFPSNKNTRDKDVKSIPSPPPLSPEQTKYDKTLAAIMSLLTELLPRPSWDSLFDLAPPPLLKVMLRTSMLVEKAEELLRNDSVQDISVHSEMYITFVRLLQRICACSETEFLVMERRRKKLHTLGLLRIAQSLPIPNDLPGFGPKTRGKIAAAAEERRRAEVLIYEENSDRKTLVEVSTNLCTQAKFFLKGAEKSEGAEFDGIEATKILGICLEIVGIKEEFEKLASRAAHSDGGSSSEGIFDVKVKHHASPAFTGKKPIPPQLGFKYHSQIAFEYTENVLKTHHYKAQAGNLKQSPRGRVLHLTRELATMSTSLPQGIFVRVEDSRPDVLKALIVGPGGTPYEGGLYEFDIWAPMEYPNTPPLCIFKTTGSGSVHFNPNLYNCGKVCLSILNTWEGAASEKWQPAISTLLQVFVSIQSMILCDNPWYNEPGRREGTQKKQSEDFNTRVRLNNVRFAMLDWIKDPEKRNGIWKDVVKAHFTENGGYLMDLIKGWAKKDPNIHNWRQGMGTLYGGPTIWANDLSAGRRILGVAASALPSGMDMVADMEGLIRTVVKDEN